MHMKIYRYVLLCSYLLLTLPQALAQDIGVLHLSPLHLELPATWSFDQSKQPIEGHGLNGEKLLISVMRKRAGPATEAVPSVKEIAQKFAHGQMSKLASKGGATIVRPLSEFPVPEGKAAYSVASEKSSPFGGKKYFIQYIFATPEVIIFLTFEGNGEALSAMRQSDTLLNTQRWDD
ncbi:hypothetical protein G4G28_17435 [Massilia sp. Dwa41.01b]|uniref:hypothetical protein n=1 Tax=unclassified Massilia TaxID=2609279 RepID=UPI001604387A|nr:MULTISPECIES: hypothetical protein [unclassified Massilia]QNA89819.1 hypothetical protein G4G28_17435 [Massilia sp. Dwa41.01b]QNB00713.1 hypothetical protein G4G31_21005 [Massilia sp. Se16.2.3]